MKRQLEWYIEPKAWRSLTPEQIARRDAWRLAEYEKLHDLLSNAIESGCLDTSHEILTEQLCRINDAEIIDWGLIP